jgi:hypothetical protein
MRCGRAVDSEVTRREDGLTDDPKGGLMGRTTFDCARVPGKHCSLQMTGNKNDVLKAARQHLVQAHGHQDGEQLQKSVSAVVDDHDQAKPYDTWYG